LNLSLFDTNGKTSRNSANLTVQIDVFQYSVVKKVWLPIQDPIHTFFHERRIVYEFNVLGPNYYALIATARINPVRSDVPAQVQFVEPEYSNVVAIAAGVAGGVLFLAALYALWYIRRRNQRRMVLAAYYQATVAAARKKKLKFAAISKTHNSIPPPPENSVAAAQKMQRHQKTAVQQPKQVAALNQSPPPPPRGISADKSLVAAAIRSKFKNANRLKLDLPAIELNQDLDFELDFSENSASFVSRISNDVEHFEMYEGDAIEVESVESDGNGERHLDALSSCSAISMKDTSDSSDLEDAGIAPPAMLPLNDFEDDLISLDERASVNPINGALRSKPSLASTRQDAARTSNAWKEQNSASFSA